MCVVNAVLLLGARADIGPELADLFVADHALPRGHLALAVRNHLIELRLRLGAQQLEVRRGAGRVQPFAMTRSAMFRVQVAAGVGRRLRAGRHGAEHGRADEDHATARRDRHGRAKTKIELWPRTALAMLLCVRLSGPADTDWPSPVKIITYCFPFTAYVIVLFMTMPATIVCHSTCPLSASKARKRRFMSPQNTRSPAVTSAEPCPACGCE